VTDDSPRAHTKKTRQWVKARGTISPAGGHEAHLAALAYMSDSYFIGTIARVHKLWRYAAVRKSKTKSSIDEDVLKKLLAMEDEDLKRVKFLDQHDLERIRKLKNGENDEPKEPKQEIGMMVSLDHTIYFHDPRGFRADEWMFTEMETPWSGDGRGLVFQKLFTKDGRLIATCVQEVCIGTPPQKYINKFRVSCGYARTTIPTPRKASCERTANPITPFRRVPQYTFAPHRLQFNPIQSRPLSKASHQLLPCTYLSPPLSSPISFKTPLAQHHLQLPQTLLQRPPSCNPTLRPPQILLPRPNRSLPPSLPLNSLQPKPIEAPLVKVPLCLT
jgi:hypothetical protein